MNLETARQAAKNRHPGRIIDPSPERYALTEESDRLPDGGVCLNIDLIPDFIPIGSVRHHIVARIS